jgi:hypothetical protein
MTKTKVNETMISINVSPARPTQARGASKDVATQARGASKVPRSRVGLV